MFYKRSDGKHPLETEDAAYWYNRGCKILEAALESPKKMDILPGPTILGSMRRFLRMGAKFIWNRMDLASESDRFNKQVAQAILHFERALVVNPEYVHAWVRKGSALLCLGRNAEALQCANRALSINPSMQSPRTLMEKVQEANLRELGKAINSWYMSASEAELRSGLPRELVEYLIVLQDSPNVRSDQVLVSIWQNTMEKIEKSIAEYGDGWNTKAAQRLAIALSKKGTFRTIDALSHTLNALHNAKLYEQCCPIITALTHSSSPYAAKPLLVLLRRLSPVPKGVKGSIGALLSSVSFSDKNMVKQKVDSLVKCLPKQKTANPRQSAIPADAYAEMSINEQSNWVESQPRMWQQYLVCRSRRALLTIRRRL